MCNLKKKKIHSFITPHFTTKMLGDYIFAYVITKTMIKMCKTLWLILTFERYREHKSQIKSSFCAEFEPTTKDVSLLYYILVILISAS